MNGIINIYKSQGMTSHDVVYKVRKILHTKKIGHTGTLDPIAEGVLPLTIGQGTKISQFIVEKEKEYVAELSFGSKTDSFDRTGQIIGQVDKIITEDELKKTLLLFTGEIDQVPPIYSAIKVDGKKLYEYAREQIQVEIKARKISIHELELLHFEFPIAKIRVACSKGTYIRSLCNDIGEKLGTFAHMTSLIRTKSGPFHLDKAISLKQLEALSSEKIEQHLYPMDFPLQHLFRVDVQPYSAKYLLNGNPLIQKNIVQNINDIPLCEKVRIYLHDEFKGVGLMENKDDYRIKPLRLFTNQ
ncbi:tRNA pseudouridine(55) synthase TruB [Alkalibaculum bacchi]|uniref:tRNA pseudouridine(55) synthase TruB n=1 Tax=Alkalibaculum bacchi TaxID=645887 RepID=UPI0026E9AF90|nr:tRNA pseudouridine(55) synthase TruB [Alkalibaculum bacchi]